MAKLIISSELTEKVTGDPLYKGVSSHLECCFHSYLPLPKLIHAVILLVQILMELASSVRCVLSAGSSGKTCELPSQLSCSTVMLFRSSLNISSAMESLIGWSSLSFSASDGRSTNQHYCSLAESILRFHEMHTSLRAVQQVI